MVGAEASAMDLRNSLTDLMAQLAVQGTRLRIEQRGQTLNIRGPLPLRDAPSTFKVQRISLGLQADATGLQEAKETLEQVQRQLDRDRFSWEDWQTTQRRSTEPELSLRSAPLNKRSSRTPAAAAPPAAAPPGVGPTCRISDA